MRSNEIETESSIETEVLQSDDFHQDISFDHERSPAPENIKKDNESTEIISEIKEFDDKKTIVNDMLSARSIPAIEDV